MAQMNCPKCGYGLGEKRARIKMMTCPSCATTLFVDSDALRLAGEQGVMHDHPMLLALGRNARIEGQTFRIIGHARYSYGAGTWDEFWALDVDGDGAWISVDEGDVVVQRRLPRNVAQGLPRMPALGETVRLNGVAFTVTEVETATCEALRGAFPEVLMVGEQHQFVNCTANGAQLLSGEFWDDQASWYQGLWVDPFDVIADPQVMA